jgi:hypothetical protein
MASANVERIRHYHSLLGSDQLSAYHASACGR